MKKFIVVLLGLFSFTIAFSQLNGDGYYRIRNVGSQRYIVVTDNKGSVDVSSTSADLGASKLMRGFSNVVSDPGSILYVNEVDGLYRFVSQGTDTHEIIGYDLKMKQNSDGSYKAYQEQGLRLYLCDARKEDTEEGVLSTRSDATNYRDWSFLPVNTADNYFGITPEIPYEGAYYSTIYASFPFTFASTGMTAYYVSKVENGIAVLSEVSNNAVPSSVPVIIKCASNSVENNQLHIGENAASKPADNLLGGVYFHNTSKAHNNLTPYNPETMRVLGLTSSGKLGFVKVDIDYLPANKAYLNVPAGTVDELVLMTKQEYNAYINQTFSVVATTSEGGTVTGSGTYKLNTQVTLTALPSEGYHFVGWSDGTSVNPYVYRATADLSLTAMFAPNEYTLTYILDGKKYSSVVYLYGKPVSPVPAPVKNGYTFSGWSQDVPATMPAHDITVTGSFTPNIYQVTYMVDGEVYKVDSVAYGSPFRVEPVPVKEGYNFIGWESVPATMPASDVVLTGTFVINKDNKFNLIYLVDGQEYKRVVLSFGDVIELVPEPVRVGYTFSGWSVVPETMPLQDVTVQGEFIVNSYTLTYMVDGEVYATEVLAYGAPIVLMDAPTKDGFIFDGWTDAPDTMPASDVVVTASYTDGIDSIVLHRLVDVYTLQGVRIKTQISKEELRELPAGIYIVNGRKVGIYF